MTVRPLLFSAPMIRALLAGRKSMSRRILKPQPPTQEAFPYSGFSLCPAIADGIKMYSQNDYERLPKHPTKWELIGSVGVARDAGFPKVYDARFAVGDLIWVRERFIPDAPSDSDAWDNWKCSFTEWDGCGREIASVPPALQLPEHVIFAADPQWAEHQDWKWRPSIHMPKWASRITLKVTAVKVERLQEISEADAIAEGVEAISLADVPRQASWSNRQDFSRLWETIHGKGTWEENPWVIAVEFETIKKNIAAVLAESAQTEAA